MSSLENITPPASVANRSSGVGSGYCSTCANLFNRNFIVATDAHRAVRFQDRHDRCGPLRVGQWFDDVGTLEPIKLVIDFRLN